MDIHEFIEKIELANEAITIANEILNNNDVKIFINKHKLDNLRKQDGNPISAAEDTIFEILEKQSGLKKFELIRKVRDSYYVLYRQIGMAVLKNNTNFTLHMIGELFGKDHATVLHSVKAIKNYGDTKDYRYNIYKEIEKRFVAIYSLELKKET